MKNAVNINGITKKYKDFTLGPVELAIPSGFATALIGANGAGKTTLIDILCGVTGKSSGEAVYFGDMNDVDSDSLRELIGYCSSANYFPQDWNTMNIASSMSIAFNSFSKEQFTKYCKRMKIDAPDKKKGKRLMKMSDGNRMRAYLAAVLARNTKLLVLDEPASSLDPLARDLLCDMFREYLAEGDGERSILFSTHNIADMEFATDYAVFMSAGKVVEAGFVEDLKEKYVLVHGDAADYDTARQFMLSCASNRTSFTGIAPAAVSEKLSALNCAVEKPNLQQLSVGILRKAEEDEG